MIAARITAPRVTSKRPITKKVPPDGTKRRAWGFVVPPSNETGARDHAGCEVDMQSIGRRRWSIAEGYIPSASSFSDRALISHETACILNANDDEAHISITVFFADREPVGPYRVTVAPRRTLHLRFNDLNDPASVPRDTDFSSVFESDVPVIVQHTRLDSRHPEVSLMSTTAYADV
jgi:hypothetical protein